VFEGNGLWREYEGGVRDWLIQSRRAQALTSAPRPQAAHPPKPKPVVARIAASSNHLPAKKKLSYKSSESWKLCRF